MTKKEKEQKDRNQKAPPQISTILNGYEAIQHKIHPSGPGRHKKKKTETRKLTNLSPKKGEDNLGSLRLNKWMS
jgi:hypothetical protein